MIAVQPGSRLFKALVSATHILVKSAVVHPPIVNFAGPLGQISKISETSVVAVIFSYSKKSNTIFSNSKCMSKFVLFNRLLNPFNNL